MPHRRRWHSKRKFKDGVYRLLSSHSNEVARDKMLDIYEGQPGGKLRYIKGEDGKYHIYEKVEGDDASP